MTEQEFKSSVIAMLRNTDIEKLIDKAMICGAIDIENQNPDNYITRKALLYVVLSSSADNWKPLSDEGIKEVKNLEKFI